MKKIITTFSFDKEELSAQGFKTERQVLAVTALADIIGQIRDTEEPFGILCFYIKDADLLGNNPVEILSNLTDKDQQLILEDYCLNRLNNKINNPSILKALRFYRDAFEHPTDFALDILKKDGGKLAKEALA